MHSRSGSARPRSASDRAAARQSATSTTPHCPRSSSRYGPAVARRAAVVDVDHREAAAGPVLHADVQHRHGLRRRAAVDHDEQRRPLPFRTAEPRVDRRVEQRPGRARLAGAVDGREPHRLRHGDLVGGQAQVPRCPQRLDPRGCTRRICAGQFCAGQFWAGQFWAGQFWAGQLWAGQLWAGQVDAVHPGLRGGAARHHDDRARARSDDRADGGEGQVEVGEGAVATAHRQAVEPVAPARHDHPPVVEHGVAGVAERPGGHADVGLGPDHGLDVAAGQPAVEVPPVGAVGEEPQRAVGPPLRLRDRLARPAGDHGLLAGREVADHQLGGVPRHRRVVPLQPGQRGAVRGVAAGPRRSRGR